MVTPTRLLSNVMSGIKNMTRSIIANVTNTLGYVRSQMNLAVATVVHTIVSQHPDRYSEEVQARVRGDYLKAIGTTLGYKIRETSNLIKNWTTALGATLRHVCSPQTTKAKDKGKSSHVSAADLRKLEDAQFKKQVDNLLSPYEMSKLIKRANQGDMQAVRILTNQLNFKLGSGRYIRSQEEVDASNRRVWQNMLTSLKHLSGEVVGIYDVQRVLTGKDPVTGEDANRLASAGWVALDVISFVVPFTKLGKGAKVGKAIDSVGDTAKVADTAGDLSKAVDTAGDTAKVADTAGDVSKLFDIGDVNSFKNANIDDVERYLDATLDGYTKTTLKRGDGLRYYDGRGNSWQLNKGYTNATDNIHGGPYLKTTVGGEIVRIPLSGGK